MRVGLLSVGLLGVSGLSYSSEAFAGGFMVPGAGPSTQGRAGAFTARADDPSTISHNPAGFAKLDGTQIYVGANFLRYFLSYQRAGVYEPGGDADNPLPYEGQPFPEVTNGSGNVIGFGGFQTLPAFAVSTDLGHPEWPVRFGFGFFSPQGFPNRDFGPRVTLDNGIEAPAPQRYDSNSQSIVLTSPSLVVAYSPTDYLDFAFRASWGIGRFEGGKTVWTLRNYEEDPGNDSIFTLSDAKDNFVPMLGLGMLFRPTDNIEIGAAWNSKGEVRAQGTGSSEIGGGSPFGDDVAVVPRPDDQTACAPGGVQGALKACLELDLAQTATLGSRYIWRDAEGEEKADIELDLRWENWSAANSSQVIVDGRVNVTNQFLRRIENPHGFRDVISTRLGGGYRFKVGGGVLEVKAGLAYDTATAPDSWTRVDIDGKERVTMTTGLGYTRGRYHFDLGLGGVWEPDITVAQCNPPYGPDDNTPGCTADGSEQPVADRDRPSPGQPLLEPSNSNESPFNAGDYRSGYLMFGLGMRAMF